MYFKLLTCVWFINVNCYAIISHSTFVTQTYLWLGRLSASPCLMETKLTAVNNVTEGLINFHSNGKYCQATSHIPYLLGKLYINQNRAYIPWKALFSIYFLTVYKCIILIGAGVCTDWKPAARCIATKQMFLGQMQIKSYWITGESITNMANKRQIGYVVPAVIRKEYYYKEKKIIKFTLQ